MTLRVGVLTTHPIQYQVPWFRLLAAQPGIDLEVLFCMVPDAAQQGDGFGVAFEWDLPLLDGYRYRVLDNVARQPSVTRFGGCDTPGIYRILRDEPWDAFIVNGWVAKSCLQLLAACRRRGVPCLVRGEANGLRRRAAWKRVIHRLLLAQYAAYLCIGQANRAFYLGHGIAAERLFDTPYCIDNHRFATEAARLRPERAALQRRFGLDPARTTYLFCGKFVAKKRPLDLLRAMERLKVVRAPVQLLMVGSGELLDECRSVAATNELPVRFAGFLNQQAIVAAYVASDCLLLPSDDGETWGLVVNEAMACGLPAIVSDRVGCHPDLLPDGETGAVYPLGDSDALAARMAELAGDRDRLAAMGGAAERRVMAGYGYAQVVDGVVAALDYVCARQGAA